jgi:hypothetical protein
VATDPIPVIRVSGTHRQVGQQIGEQMRPQLQRLMAQMRQDLPPGVSWDAMLQKGRLCLAHANHYVSPPMRRFEADRNDIGGSVIRHNRAMRLLRENRGQLSPALFQELLADHANYPSSICKHAGESVTAFSIIIDLDELRAWIGRGRPCQTTYVEHTLEPWAPPELSGLCPLDPLGRVP